MFSYCRHCGYDLRGQTIFRCSECAAAFDPADPATFESRSPSRFGGLARRVRTRDVAVLLMLTLLLAASYAGRILLPEGHAERALSIEATARFNLQPVIRLWRDELKADPSSARAALDRALAAAPPAYSFKTQTGMMRARRVWMDRCGEAASWTAHLIPYGLLIVLACRKRIAAFGAVVLFGSLAFVLLCGFARSHPPRAYQPDRAYLNDYVFLTDVDESDAADTSRVAAFEKPPWTGRVTVARMNGAVHGFSVDDFRRLAETEGFADRVPR